MSFLKKFAKKAQEEVWRFKVEAVVTIDEIVAPLTIEQYLRRLIDNEPKLKVEEIKARET